MGQGAGRGQPAAVRGARHERAPVQDEAGSGARLLLSLGVARGDVLRRPAERRDRASLKNPGRAREVDVVQVANDPVNARLDLRARDTDGNNHWTAATRCSSGRPAARGRVGGAVVLQEPAGRRIPGLRRRCLPPRDGVRHFGRGGARGARSARRGTQDAVLSWGRISRWLPWMKMGDRDGLVVFHTAGMRLDRGSSFPRWCGARSRRTTPPQGAAAARRSASQRDLVDGVQRSSSTAGEPASSAPTARPLAAAGRGLVLRS